MMMGTMNSYKGIVEEYGPSYSRGKGKNMKDNKAKGTTMTAMASYKGKNFKYTPHPTGGKGTSLVESSKGKYTMVQTMNSSYKGYGYDYSSSRRNGKGKSVGMKSMMSGSSMNKMGKKKKSSGISMKSMMSGGSMGKKSSKKTSKKTSSFAGPPILIMADFSRATKTNPITLYNAKPDGRAVRVNLRLPLTFPSRVVFSTDYDIHVGGKCPEYAPYFYSRSTIITQPSVVAVCHAKTNKVVGVLYQTFVSDPALTGDDVTSISVNTRETTLRNPLESTITFGPVTPLADPFVLMLGGKDLKFVRLPLGNGVEGVSIGDSCPLEEPGASVLEPDNCFLYTTYVVDDTQDIQIVGCNYLGVVVATIDLVYDDQVAPTPVPVPTTSSPTVKRTTAPVRTPVPTAVPAPTMPGVETDNPTSMPTRSPPPPTTGSPTTSPPVSTNPPTVSPPTITTDFPTSSEPSTSAFPSELPSTLPSALPSALPSTLPSALPSEFDAVGAGAEIVLDDDDDDDTALADGGGGSDAGVVFPSAFPSTFPSEFPSSLPSQFPSTEPSLPPNTTE